MCFSPEASFAAAAVLGAAGAATLSWKPPPRHLPFALIPLVFALQQSIEGSIWLSVLAGRAPPDALVFAYLFIAQVFWPVYTPLAALAMERDRRRRAALFMLLVAGVGVAVALGAVLLRHDYSVAAEQHSLRYFAGRYPLGNFMIGLYMLATVGPLLASQYRYVAAFGAVVFVGALVTAAAYNYAAASVWCFFAAAASLLVFLHVRGQARLAA